MYKFNIQQLSWFKRRAPTKQPQPISVKIPNFEKTQQHLCDVFVVYDDNIERKLMGRVIYNNIKNTWHVSAIANGGLCLSLTVIEQ